MNPKIGFTGDFLVDISDVESEWKKATSQGINIRSGELSLAASIDPYAELLASVNIGLQGAELHELMATFPTIGRGFSLTTGWKLANFGRWNQFHTHSMPFTAEPRIYMEYFGGHFSALGAELSWLVPAPFYLEATVSLYDGIHGHSHDNDPSAYESELDQLAAEMGLTKHGSHWHAKDGSIVSTEELYDGDEPTTEVTNRSIGAFPIAGRLKSSIEFGDNLSLDLAGSAVYQKKHRHSKRVDKAYAKAVYGTDLTFFWHPLTKNKYRNFDTGVELLLNFEENEEISNVDSSLYKVSRWRKGIFGHFHYRHNSRLHWGAYGELFEAQNSEAWLKKRVGLFTTVEISHYQYLRLEGSSYKQSPDLPPVHRLTLQYDVTIGYHSHGTQR